ncbi:MAG: hypothetical protein WC145_13595 [Aliarcobacter sp.]|jgi:hypothetical protein
MQPLDALKDRVAARIAAARAPPTTPRPEITLTEEEVRAVRLARLQARITEQGEALAVWDDLSTRLDAGLADLRRAQRRAFLVRLVVDALLVAAVCLIVLVLGNDPGPAAMIS